jgi:tetratricopeptide (TPR) repeat protein
MRLNEELRRIDGRAIQLCNLGIAFRHQRRRREALDVLQEALLLNRRLRRREGVAECLSTIAGVYYDSGQPGDALRYLARALKIERAIDDREGLAGDLELRGRIHEDRGAMRRAVEMYRESRNHYRYFGHFRKAAEMARRIGCLSRS